MPLDILFEDEHLVVVNKPAGLSTQAPRGIDSLELYVRAYLQAGSAAGAKPVYLGLPHRLDRPASGVIVMAKTKKAARKLSRQFERRRVRKLYWAAVEGTVEPVSGTWTDHLGKVPGEAHAEIVPPKHPDAQQAVLHFRTLGTTPHGSWLQIELETGRMHQVRVQAASRGWPVVGDAQYGGRTPFGTQYDDVRLRAIALHARELSFVPPEADQMRTFVAPPWEAWRELGIDEGTSAA